MAKPVILCVDDEKIVLDSLKAQLNDIFMKEFDVEFAESGAEAIEIIEELLEDDIEIPIVISDFIMPKMNGEELLLSINELIPSSRKILLTGEANANERAERNNHMFVCLPKPWNKNELIDTIKLGLAKT